MVAPASTACPSWTGRNHEHLPQLRNGLERAGWSVQETPSDVRLILSGTQGAGASPDTVLGEDAEPSETEAPDASFGLESHLRDFIAQNISTIDGIEFPTAVGPIDILATDDSGAFFVFELKRARSPDHAMGQLTRYMGWVRQTIGKDREVSGIIVAKDISDSLRYAVAVVPNVSLFEYEVEFHLKPAHQIR